MTRVFHRWDRWKCFSAGFYANEPNRDVGDPRRAYADFLSNDGRFSSALDRVTSEWIHSSEHFLTNRFINRIAWLGQASMCIATGVPSCFRGGFFLLPIDRQRRANQVAADCLEAWLRGRHHLDIGSADSCSETDFDYRGTTQQRVAHYLSVWQSRDYADGIPDSVPDVLMRDNLAPSDRAISCAFLRNDLQLLSLGFSAGHSDCYDALKQIELRARPKPVSPQMELF